MDDTKCFVCSGNKQNLCKINKNLIMHQCLACGAMWQVPLLEAEDYKDIYDESYYRDIWGYSEKTDSFVARSKFVMSKPFIELIGRFKKSGRVLDVGAGLGYALSIMQCDEYGYDVYGVELSSFAREVCEKRIGKGKMFASLEEVKEQQKESTKEKKFDVIAMFDSMEHIPDQEQLFKDIDALLAEKGIVFVMMPDCSSWTRKVMWKKWIEFKKDHVLFYSKDAFRTQLEKQGYVIEHFSTPWKRVTIYYLISYLSVFRIPFVSSFLEAIRGILPQFVLDLPVAFPLGHMAVVFRKR
jgi:2-polyprenyl-3-methyl-5-hydroxy-6-metoxy-1,4-benzoquinol methylase